MTRAGRTVLFVSHDANSVARLCQRGIVLGGGGVEFAGDVDAALEHYLGGRRAVHGDGHLGDVEREGSGEARFCDVRISGVDGSAIVADQPIEVRLTFATSEPLAGDHLELQLGISSAAGGQLASLSTRFDPEQPLDRTRIEHGTTIDCVIEELPLKPGHYRLSLSLDRLGHVIDRVADQIEFSVLPSDFFGSGVLPREQQAPVLVRHRWKVVEPAAVEQEGTPRGRR
ncbi:MAG: Wzt carbohydrate-binding domain-containing protein [Actinobacteria bacterium]|nr:Wzt carbohydrate-binding domain-containing protein [Actinomycetota bacterium]